MGIRGWRRPAGGSAHRRKSSASARCWSRSSQPSTITAPGSTSTVRPRVAGRSSHSDSWSSDGSAAGGSVVGHPAAGAGPHLLLPPAERPVDGRVGGGHDEWTPFEPDRLRVAEGWSSGRKPFRSAATLVTGVRTRTGPAPAGRRGSGGPQPSKWNGRRRPSRDEHREAAVDDDRGVGEIGQVGRPERAAVAGLPATPATPSSSDPTLVVQPQVQAIRGRDRAAGGGRHRLAV